MVKYVAASFYLAFKINQTLKTRKENTNIYLSINFFLMKILDKYASRRAQFNKYVQFIPRI